MPYKTKEDKARYSYVYDREYNARPEVKEHKRKMDKKYYKIHLDSYREYGRLYKLLQRYTKYVESLKNVEHYSKEFKLYDGFKAELIEYELRGKHRGQEYGIR